MASTATIAGRRESMFSQLGNDQVWSKNDPTTLIYALLDAIAKEHGNFQDEDTAAHNDISLSTISRPDNLQAMWGDMLQEQIRGDITWQQNIAIWQQMLKLMVWGTSVGGTRFMPTTKDSILQLILAYSLVAGCKIFEFWSDVQSFIGSAIIADALAFNVNGKAWNTGYPVTWLDVATLKALAYVPAGFQVFPEITGYTRDTNVIAYAANLLKPYHNLIGFCWMLTLANQVYGYSANAASIQLGTGTGVGPGCTLPVATKPAFINSLTPLKYVSSAFTNFHRISTIVTDADLPQTIDLTEACILDGTGTPLAGSYQTFSAIHKVAGSPIAMGFYESES